ncbi:DUF4402 domain-containing protein [Phenylobacterium sp.]|uniref:DUF4402 domain-containing protein n=1 Tax=Phenylobacterium sp. TaxID=1871053 RepID=UPI0035AF6838
MRAASITQLLIAATLVLWGGGAAAQTYGVGVTSNTPNLGRVASAASGNTVFRVNPSSGLVTRVSGSGARIDTGATRATVTISCGSTNACNTDNVNVRIGASGTGGRGRALTNFTVAMGTASLVTAPSGTNPINFRIGPIGKNSSKTFYVGADFPIAGNDSGSASGAAFSAFYVWADDAPNTPTGNQADTGEAVATVFRPLAISKISDLSFGRIVKPVSGTGGVVGLAAANSGRSFPPGVTWLNLPAPGRATYTVTGEGGQMLSINIPPSFTMVGPSGSSLTVTTDDTAPTSPVLSAVSGTGGSYTFYVGGSFPITPTTRNGGYTGTFNVTVSYN